MKYYKCRECGALMTEDELIDREVCIRGEDNHEYYHRASECPFCGELSCFDEYYYDEDELIDREVCIRGEDNREYYHIAGECPFCGELSCFDEFYYDEEDIPDLVMEVSDLREKLEDQKKLIKLLKKSVEVENGKAKINMSEELNKALIELIK